MVVAVGVVHPLLHKKVALGMEALGGGISQKPGVLIQAAGRAV